MDDSEFGEKIKSSSKGSVHPTMTLQKAIDLGEYFPEFLANFPEWHSLSRHSQFQMIRQALDNRRHQLLTQWAEINNVIDFSLKPEMATALENLQKQIKKLENDREDLYLEYSKP